MASTVSYVVLCFDLDEQDRLVRKGIQPCKTLADAVMASARMSMTHAGTVVLRCAEAVGIAGAAGVADNDIVALYALGEYTCGLWPKPSLRRSKLSSWIETPEAAEPGADAASRRKKVPSAM